MNNTKFALVLRQCRENSGLTQKQVADALGVDRSTYAYYETGVTCPMGLTIIKISNILNINYSVLMDAISDFDYDQSEDNEGFTTLSDTSWRDREKIYTLGKLEQNLIIKFRTLTNDQKEYIIDELDKLRAENFEKEKAAKKGK